MVRPELDFESAEFIADPYPVFASIRPRSPVLWHDKAEMWLALSYEHANTVLRDRRFGRIWTDREPADTFEPFNRLHRHQMMENEPPEHSRLRGPVARAFARGHIQRLRPRINAMANELLDAIDGTDQFDVLADFAAPLPVAVIAELLGVPVADRHLLRPWSNAIVKMYEYGRTPLQQAQAITAAQEFADYMHALADERRRATRDDLVSHLVALEAGDTTLTDDELVASVILLLNAGHEASVNVFGNGIVALFHHPTELARLRADPSLIASAVEEMIRFDPPLHLFERTATEDVQIGGQLVEQGQKIAALLGSANRDPAAFANADEMDLARDPNPHIGFGAGVHFCLGAPLARLELQISLPALLHRFPRLALATKPVLRPTFVLRGYESIPVTSAN